MKDRRLLIGTNNPQKLKDFQAILGGLDLELITPVECGITDSPAEDASTFEQNSLAKATFYWERVHVPCLTDDSGAEIAFLHGAPGVRTRRWDSEEELTDEVIRTKAIAATKAIPADQRQMQLRNVVTFMFGDDQFAQAEGVVPGVLQPSDLQMTPGYPFDVLLYLPQFQQWYVQAKKEHPELNHRRQALLKLLPHIQQFYHDPVRSEEKS